jgi:hypothetical protein
MICPKCKGNSPYCGCGSFTLVCNFCKKTFRCKRDNHLRIDGKLCDVESCSCDACSSVKCQARGGTL